MENTFQNKVGIVGEITALIHRQDNPWLQAWNSGLRWLFKAGIISRASMIHYYKLGRLQRKHVKKNIITTAGLSVLAQILVGEYLDTGEITEMALGDGAGTPALGDTALFNEVYRNARASSTSSGGIAISTAFYTEIEVDGTFTEFGNFIDDTEMFSHVAVSWTKSAVETLTVQCRYTIANSA